MTAEIEMASIGRSSSSPASTASVDSSRSVSPMKLEDRIEKIVPHEFEAKMPQKVEPQSILPTGKYTVASKGAIKAACLFNTLVLAGAALFIAGAFGGNFTLILAGAGTVLTFGAASSVTSVFSGSFYFPGWDFENNQFKPIALVESYYPLREVGGELIPDLGARTLTLPLYSEVIDRSGGDWSKYIYEGQVFNWKSF